MDTIRITQYVGDDGILKLELPVNISHQTVDVLVVLQPVDEEAATVPSDFFERLDAIQADDMVERGEQPPPDVRDVLR